MTGNNVAVGEQSFVWSLVGRSTGDELHDGGRDREDCIGKTSLSIKFPFEVLG